MWRAGTLRSHRWGPAAGSESFAPAAWAARPSSTSRGHPIRQAADRSRALAAFEQARRRHILEPRLDHPLKLSARRAVRAAHDAVRTQLWPLPILGVAVAAALGVLIPHLDLRVDAHLPPWMDAIVFSGDAGAARTVLDAVASSLITVTSLTFSLTVVTLQLASSQFSPRLLRTFTQDIFVQVTLAIFLATFTFSLTVLRAVRSSDGSVSPFVPRLAVTTSFFLAVASVVCLVLFLAHLTRQIRVETMLRNVHLDATETVTTNLKPRGSTRPDPAANEKPPTDAEVLWAWQSGFLLRIDQDQLSDAARAAGLTMTILRHPGDFVVDGTPLGATWSPPGQPVSNRARATFDEKLRTSVHLGPERTAAQDVGYGLRQLTDVTNKALSPGINDPTTAIHALGHSAALLAELTNYELGPLVLCDAEGTVRVILHRPDFAHFMDLAVTQPRSYGKADSQVLTRLYELLRDVAWHARPEHRQPIIEQLDRLRATAHAQDFDESEFAHLDAAEWEVQLALSGARRT